MPNVKITVVDYNTGRPIPGAFVDLNGHTGYTNTMGVSTLSLEAKDYSIKVLHADYTPYSYPVTILANTQEVKVRLIPLVRVL